MNSSETTIYEKAVTTYRPAEELAQKHGFECVAQLADSLPPHAQVLDVGAGDSPFGSEVAVLRPDITWVNYDYSYKDSAAIEDLVKGAPSNVQYISGDVARLAEYFDPDTFDAVFSFWLFPHLSIDDSEPARAAAKEVFAVTKPGGSLSIGPKIGKTNLPSIRSRGTYHATKDDELSSESFADAVVAATKLRGIALRKQRLANEVATPFFETTRYSKEGGRLPRIYHKETGEYVSSMSLKGIRTLGRLSIALAKHIKDNRKK